jgi:hypothetical protein
MEASFDAANNQFYPADGALSMWGRARSKATVPNYQNILDLLSHGLTVEAREKILELREVTLRLQEENLSLKEQLMQRHGDRDLCAQMHFGKGVYWLRTPTDDGTNVKGPYCQVCHDRDERPVRLHWNDGPEGGWYCAACGNHF